VTLGSLEDFRVPLFITAERGQHVPFTFQVKVADQASGQVKRLEARFLGPPGPVAGTMGP
jgi:hypothetical protein